MTEQAKVPAIRFAGFTDPWEQRKLGELMDVASVRRVHQEDWTDEGVRFLRARDLVAFAKNESIEDPLFISSEMYKEYSAQSGKVSVGDLLVTGVGTIGVPWLVTSDNPVYFKDGNIIWFKNRHSIDGGFFYHSFTASAIQNCINEAAGIGTVGTYTIETGKKTPIWLPSRQEQREIAAMMTHLDDLITLHQRKYDKLVIFKKSMLEKMFPKDGESVPEIRFAGFTDPWEQRKLGNCGTTYSGLSGKTKEDFGHGNARFVPYTNVFDNPLADTERLEAVEIDSSQNKVAYGDVFFTVSSETPDEVGMSSVWLSDQDDVYLNSFCFGYRQDSTFDPHYLAYMLRSSSIRSDLTLLAQGISRFNISKNKVMELSVAVPSAAEQKQIGQYFARLDSLITLHQRKLELLRNIKKSLLDKMFV
ncbi:restriction endonuclease subunit S [Bifidobacterium bifidum]|uniref:restriction endonuclease subunit S n=1 Tax=Bifidobacterium bifidum TaxID=1681 RepID=UPI003267287D